MRICPKCKNLKDESEFYPSKRAKDGLSSYCKSCKVIKVDGKKYKDLPLYLGNEHWEIYAKIKTSTDLLGKQYQEPCSDYIFKLRLDGDNWVEIKASRFYPKRNSAC